MTWMTQLFNNEVGFNTRTLSDITIPGTHDSGCYIDRFGKDTGAKTQTQTIRQQLDGGIRYFDIRPCKYRQDQYWTWHGPLYYGDQLHGANGILAQIVAFMANLANTDRELVILNISHFNYARFSGGFDHARFINLITNALGAHLVPHTQANINLFTAQYDQLLTDATPTTCSRVAIIYDGAFDEGRDAYITANALPQGFFKLADKYPYNAAAAYPMGNEIRLFDQYAAKREVYTNGNVVGMANDQRNKIEQRANYNYTAQAWGVGMGPWAANAAVGVPGTLHLFSWTLTVPPYSPVDAANTYSNGALLPYFRDHWRYVRGQSMKINILYIDNFDSHAAGAGPFVGQPMPVAIAHRMNQAGLPFAGWNDL